MAVINNTKSNKLLSGTSGNDTIQNGGYWDDSYHDGGLNVTINTGAGNDSVENWYCEKVTINIGAGNDSVCNFSSSSVTINTDEGNDEVWNYSYSDSVTINTGAGNDSVFNEYGSSLTINTGAGNDSVFNEYGSSVTINTGAGNDSVFNEYGSSVTINTSEGNDSVFNEHGSSVTINTGAGNDSIYNNWNFREDAPYDDNGGSNVLFKYSSGDGNDIIYGFKADSTLSIGGGSYSTKKSGDNVIVTVGTGKISLIGAASLDKVNIKGTKASSSSNNIFSKVNVTDFGGKSKKSVRNKALTGFETLLRTDMSDVILKNVDGIKTLDDPTRKKLSSLSSIFNLAGKANDGFSILGSLCSSAETFLGLVKSEKRDANWGKQVSDCVKNLLKFGNSVLKISDKELAKSLGLGLGGSLFGLAGSIIATTDGINDKERDNIVKDLFTVSGEFAKLVIPNAKVPSMEINLVVATASALYMGDVQMQKSIEKYSSDGSFTLTDFRDAKIDSVMVSLDEFARKMTLNTSDIFFNWLDKKTGGSSYSDMTYIEKAAEGYKILFNYIGDQSVKLAKSVGNSIGNWWTKVTESFSQKGLNLKGDSKNNVLLGGSKKDTLNGGAGNDKIYGEAGNDSLVGGDGADTLSGGAGNDKLFGQNGNDSIVGGDGADTLSGGAGNDKLYGQNGNDSLVGGDGKDTLSGGKGNDKLFGGNGNDLLGGGDDKDILSGGSGNDTLWGDAGNDSLSGGKDNDVLVGGIGNDTLCGDSGDDVLAGWDGKDILIGGSGNDSLWGDAGNDSLSGGKGNDSLWGDAGKDTFIYSSGDGKDVIYGFENNDLLKITGTFSGTYNSSKKEVYFKIGSTAKAITLHDFTASTFKVNGSNYKISGSKLVKS